MKTFADYVDTYGRNGWKTDFGWLKSASVMMVKDEVANPGTTDLSKFDRKLLLKLDSTNEFTLMTGTIYKLYYAIPDGTPPDTTDYTGMTLDQMDAAYEPYVKQYAEIKFAHGGTNDPFTRYTDTITNDGKLIKDYAGTIQVDQVLASYQGLSNLVALDLLFSEHVTDTAVIQTEAEFATALARAIETGVATTAQVQAKFGTYAPSAVTTALAQTYGENTSVTLPRLAALDDSQSTLAFKAYLAYFGRPPDTGGLTSWVNVLNDPSRSMDSLIESFGNSAESNALYSNSSSGTRVDAIYHYLFNREPDAEGRAFWVNAIDKGVLSMAGAALNILNGARLDDLTLVNQKVAAARSFVEGLDTQHEISLYSGDTAALNARKYLSTITTDESHNTQVVALVGQVINLLGTGVEPLFSQHGISLGYY